VRQLSRFAIAAALMLGCASLSHAAETARAPQFLSSPSAEARGLPFSEAVRAGDFLFLAGQIGDDHSTGRLVPGGVVPEARQALTHIRNVLERNGASLEDVVKCTVFLADIGDWPAFNEVYREFFRKPFPARSALGASGLALGARVEIECIAYVPSGPAGD
jgi:reactive intermediate/imine deaminase